MTRKENKTKKTNIQPKPKTRKGRVDKYKKREEKIKKEIEQKEKKVKNIIYTNNGTITNKTNTNKTKKNKKFNGEKFVRFIILSILAIALGSSVLNIAKLQLERKQLLEENKSLISQKKALKEELKQVNDLEYIEEQARVQLKMIKPGEVLFILEENEENSNIDNTEEEIKDKVLNIFNKE